MGCSVSTPATNEESVQSEKLQKQALEGKDGTSVKTRVAIDASTDRRVCVPTNLCVMSNDATLFPQLKDTLLQWRCTKLLFVSKDALCLSWTVGMLMKLNAKAASFVVRLRGPRIGSFYAELVSMESTLESVWLRDLSRVVMSVSASTAGFLSCQSPIKICRTLVRPMHQEALALR